MISLGEWTVWTRGRADEPREVKLYRQVVDGYQGLKALWSGVDEYAAIFSREQIERQEFDTIFTDIDAHVEGEDWMSKAETIFSKCDIQPSRVYVTGRGGHAYWDLDEPIKGVGRYKQVAAAMMKKWGLTDLVDRHVVGDVRRMARLPMSMNSKGGCMLRVEPSQIRTLKDSLTPDLETLTRQVPQTVHLVIGEVHDVDEGHFTASPEARRIYSEAEYAPCIKSGIKQMMETGELDHLERLHVFSYLVQNDEMEKGFEILRKYAGDFDAGISRYQLNYLATTRHKPFKCKNVPADLCPFDDKRECPYWPSVNLWRSRRLENHV